MQLVKEINELADGFTLKINHEIFNLKQKYDSITKILTIETNKTLEKYSELNDLKNLQASYESALTNINLLIANVEKNALTLKRDRDEFSREISYFKNKVNEEIEQIANYNHELLKELVAVEFAKKDAENLSKVKLLESRILKLEQSLWNNNDLVNRDLNKIYKDMDIFKSVLSTMSKADNSNYTRQIDIIFDNLSKLELASASINNQLYMLQNKINKEVSVFDQRNTLDTSSQTITAFFGKDYEQEYKKLTNRLIALENLCSGLSTKNTTLIITAYSSIAIALLSILLAFVL